MRLKAMFREAMLELEQCKMCRSVEASCGHSYVYFCKGFFAGPGQHISGSRCSYVRNFLRIFLATKKRCFLDVEGQVVVTFYFAQQVERHCVALGNTEYGHGGVQSTSNGRRGVDGIAQFCFVRKRPASSQYVSFSICDHLRVIACPCVWYFALCPPDSNIEKHICCLVKL